jgi:N-methylhydantoinase A
MTGGIWRLGVDIGGTFTDVALEGPPGRFTIKVLTTHGAPDEAVLDGMAQVLAQAGIDAGSVDLVIHGTTLATNALIERRGARTVLITTDGFRDSLEMGTESRFDQYDLGIEKPAPLIPRHLRLTVRERMSARGDILIPFDPASVAALLPQLRQNDIESVAIGFLHAYIDPRHERAARDVLASALPDLAISLSSDVSPEIREYERISTTCANAYVQPKVAGYLRRLETRMRAAGYGCPLLMILSNGGLCDLDTAIRYPVRLVESGPAGGAILAADLAQRLGLAEVLSYDMGGTTAKICLIDDARPKTARDFEVARVYRFKRGSGLPVRIPVIEMVEIGAGGGSLCSVNTLGMIAVGPESAGSEPGPACYGRGGTGATVSDANLQVGRLDAAGFAGGRMTLDRAGAEEAIARHVAKPLGLDVDTAALGILEMVDENMANAAREHAVESAKSLEGRTMIAFGGCAPLHAGRLAQKLGIDRVIVPVGAGVGSAIGFLRAPVAYEVVRSLRQPLASLDPLAVERLLGGMEDEARGFVRRAAPTDALLVERSATMRYVGQRHEIFVPLPAGRLTDAAHLLRAAFEEAYRKQFGRVLDKVEAEAIGWSVVVRVRQAAPPALATQPVLSAAFPISRRTMLDPASGRTVDAGVYRRAQLPPGATLTGPAVILEDETTSVVPPGFHARIDGLSNIVMERIMSDQQDRAA